MASGGCNAALQWWFAMGAPPPACRLPPLPLTAVPFPLLPAVHYIGRIAETGEVFMDTRQESPTQEPQEIVSGRGEFAGRAGGRCTSATTNRTTPAASRTVFADACETDACPIQCSNMACRFGVPGAGPAPGSGGHAVRGALPPVGGSTVWLRRAGQLLLPNRASQCRSSVSGRLGRGQPGGCGCPAIMQLVQLVLQPPAQPCRRNCLSAALCPAHSALPVPNPTGLMPSPPTPPRRALLPLLQLRAGAA